MIDKALIYIFTMAAIMLAYFAVDAANSDTGAGYLHLFCLFLSGWLARSVFAIIFKRD